MREESTRYEPRCHELIRAAKVVLVQAKFGPSKRWHRITKAEASAIIREVMPRKQHAMLGGVLLMENGRAYLIE